jgi:hypothetical protein
VALPGQPELARTDQPELEQQVPEQRALAAALLEQEQVRMDPQPQVPRARQALAPGQELRAPEQRGQQQAPRA